MTTMPESFADFSRYEIVKRAEMSLRIHNKLLSDDHYAALVAVYNSNPLFFKRDLHQALASCESLKHKGIATCFTLTSYGVKERILVKEDLIANFDLFDLGYLPVENNSYWVMIPLDKRADFFDMIKDKYYNVHDSLKDFTPFSTF